MPYELTQSEFTQLFGKQANQISKLIAEGMPVIKQGKTKTFDLEEVARWLMDNHQPPQKKLNPKDEAHIRKLEAEARYKEIVIQERMGELVSIDDVQETITAEYSMIRQTISSLSGLSHDLYMCQSESEMIEVLENAARNLCERLRQDIILDDNEGDADIPSEQDA